MATVPEDGLDLVAHLYSYFRAERDRHRREDGVVWVTDLTSCRLKEEFSRKYPELEMAELFNPVTVTGTLVHYGLEYLFSKMFGGDYQVHVEPEASLEVAVGGQTGFPPVEPVSPRTVTVKGRIDVILERGGERVGVEIKTARSDLSLPHEHHVDQVKIYNTIFNLSKSYLIYVTPDRISQYAVDKAMPVSEIARRVVDGAAPRYHWECQYCPFAVLCPRKVTQRK